MTISPFELLERVWTQAKAEGVQLIHYNVAAPPWLEPGGRFVDAPSREIYIVREHDFDHAIDSPADTPHALSDLCLLAHEYGHFRSWKASAEGTADEWREYRAAIEVRGDDAERLSSDQKQVIMAEEHRAWEIAKRTLKALGLDTWNEFERLKAIGLQRNAAAVGLEG